MKRILFNLMALSLLPLAAFALEIDSAGLPGDNFSLDGALELFKLAENPEAFEKALNTEDNYANNLDLNGDGEIDYVKVIDQQEDDAHVIILQAVISKEEAQDIAVIEIERTGENEAILQIIGDEDLYGEEMIIEPFEEDPGKGGPWVNWGGARVVVNVWLWPSVRYIYRPGYRLWVSPWRWMYYPTWYRPWRPHPYHWFIGVRPRLHVYYHPVTIHRVSRAHTIYAPRRTTSVTVHKHYDNRLTTYRNQKGIVNTKKTTVVEGAQGGKTVIRQERTAGRVANQNGGSVGGQKTETKITHVNPDGDKKTVSRKSSSVGVNKADGSRSGVRRNTTKVESKSKNGTKKVKRTTTKAKKSTRRH